MGTCLSKLSASDADEHAADRAAGRPWIMGPRPVGAPDTPENPWLFWGCLKWKKVMDDFFHGQRGRVAGMPGMA